MNPRIERATPEVAPGVTIDDLVTIEQCDKALDQIVASVSSIEEQLERHGRSPNQPGDWKLRAQRALRMAKLSLPRVQQKRADLVKQQRATAHEAALAEQRRATRTKDRLTIEIVHEIAPDVLARAGQIAHQRHPEVFGRIGGEARHEA